MKTINLLGGLICLSLFITSCGLSSNTPSSDKEVILSEESFHPYPSPIDWNLADDMVLHGEGFSLALHWIQLSYNQTTLCYSITGSSMEEMAGEGSISIISDTGSMSKLIRIIPFAKLDKLEIGILQFEPRSAGIRELYLQLNLEPGFSNSYKLFFARQDGLLEYGYISSTFLMGRQGVVEQAGFRIAFEGWGPGPNAQLYNPTEVEPSSSTTPNSPLPISTPFIRPLTTISPEASVYRTVSLRIEDIHNHRVHYLTIQMISNGQVLGLFDDFLVESEPMPTETKMDYSAPYPMTPQPTSTSPYP